MLDDAGLAALRVVLIDYNRFFRRRPGAHIDLGLVDVESEYDRLLEVECEGAHEDLDGTITA